MRLQLFQKTVICYLIPVKLLSATEAARRFSDVLDAVETRGETFLVVRRGRVVAHIARAGGTRGSVVKELVRRSPRDAKWADDIARARRLITRSV
jgi:antitoxin (DNA-binding transcriptional repressor) of toxin-antitoxin stability system